MTVSLDTIGEAAVAAGPRVDVALDQARDQAALTAMAWAIQRLSPDRPAAAPASARLTDHSTPVVRRWLEELTAAGRLEERDGVLAWRQAPPGVDDVRAAWARAVDLAPEAGATRSCVPPPWPGSQTPSRHSSPATAPTTPIRPPTSRDTHSSANARRSTIVSTRHTTRAAAGLCTVVAALGACSSSPESGAPQSGGAASSSVAQGGTLRVGAVGTGAAPTTDPHGALFAESDWVRLSALYDTLTTRGKGGSVAPSLAQSWTPSQDASSWTFTLRKDAKFSDGTPVTAGDALFSIGRMVKKSADNGGRAGKIDMTRSKATDDHTLLLATSTPDAELPRSLTLGSFVVKKGTNDFTKPVGSGPFRLESSTDAAAVLAANPYWWGGKPGVDRVELRGFADPQAMGQAVTGGSIDLALGVQPATAKAASAGGAQLVRSPGSETAPLLMRVDKAPFTDARVRKAVSMALDRKALVDQVYLGYGAVGKDMIKLDEPGVPGDAPEIKRDVDGAKKLLAEAGHGGGLDVVLNTTTAYPAMAASATIVKQQLAEVGINVEVKSHAPDQYWTKVYGVEPFAVGYYGDAPFTTLVRAAMLSTSPYSETGWKDPAFDKAYAETMGTIDDGARQRKLGELHRMLAQKSGRVVWGFGERLTLHRPGVKGVSADDGTWDLSRVTVGG